MILCISTKILGMKKQRNLEYILVILRDLLMDWLLESKESVLSTSYDNLDHSLLDLGMVWCWRALLGWQRQW